MIKKFILLIFFSLMFSCSICIFAHENIHDIDFEDCKFLTENDDENDVMWYALDTNNKVVHLDNDIDTIKYYFSDASLVDSSYTWTTNFSEENAELVKETYADSMKKWNEVYYYTYDEYGNRISNKIINVIEGTETDNNLIIYPRESNNDFDNVIASTILPQINDNLIDQRVTNDLTLSHYHSNNWKMKINRDLYYNLCFNSSSKAKYKTGMHELGHVLGLFDLDVECDCEPKTHSYAIMGYGNEHDNITYYDIAGVSITRGFHTNEDHIWMKRINENETVDLICSLCNGILYNVDIDLNSNSYNNKPLNDYQSCVHYDGSNYDMLLVATNGIQDFYKCQYCRHIETITYYDEENIGNNNMVSTSIELGKYEVQYIKFNVQANNNYIFHLKSDLNIEYELYDSSFNKIGNRDSNKKRDLFTEFLNVGTYYLKCKFTFSSMFGTIDINILNNISSNGIIVDPSSVDYCGTQITMIEKDLTNKSYRNTFITKGFTRHIYLDTLYAPSDSRKSYYWYTSNEDILEVTEYGTVLGKSVGTAKIYGVYINNPTIVFVKEFTVINNLDETTIEIEFSQSYSLSSSEPCKIALNSYNSPFPKNQYYEFTFIGNNNGATIDKYGIIRNISKIGEIKIRCRYILNTKYVIIVKLTVSD